MKLLHYLRIFSKKIITAPSLIQRPILSKIISNLSSLVCQVTYNFKVFLVTIYRFSRILWIPPISNVLTSQWIVPFEKPIGLQLVKKFSVFYRTKRFIIAPTKTRHLSLPCHINPVHGPQSQFLKFDFNIIHTNKPPERPMQYQKRSINHEVAHTPGTSYLLRWHIFHIILRLSICLFPLHRDANIYTHVKQSVFIFKVLA